MVHTAAESRASAAVDNTRAAWARRGLLPDRLKFLPPFRYSELVQAMGAISDVALDTSSYGGGVTSYDALYAGLPLVHRPGGWKMMQRAGGSILTAAGMGNHLIVETVEEYVDVAVRLGVDPDYRRKMSNRLKDALVGKGGAPLFHPEVGVRAFVWGLWKACMLWYEGKPPAPIFADNAPGDAAAAVHEFKHTEPEDDKVHSGKEEL